MPASAPAVAVPCVRGAWVLVSISIHKFDILEWSRSAVPIELLFRALGAGLGAERPWRRGHAPLGNTEGRAVRRGCTERREHCHAGGTGPLAAACGAVLARRADCAGRTLQAAPGPADRDRQPHRREHPRIR